MQIAYNIGDIVTFKPDIKWDDVITVWQNGTAIYGNHKQQIMQHLIDNQTELMVISIGNMFEPLITVHVINDEVYGEISVTTDDHNLCPTFDTWSELVS